MIHGGIDRTETQGGGNLDTSGGIAVFGGKAANHLQDLLLPGSEDIHGIQPESVRSYSDCNYKQLSSQASLQAARTGRAAFSVNCAPMSTESVSVARRRFLRASLGATAAALGWRQVRPLLIPEALAGAAKPAGLKPIGDGVLLGVLPFVDDGNFPRGKLIGKGLAARQVLDLSRLNDTTMVTPTDQFFIRTGFPGRLQTTANWKLRVRGLIDGPAELTLEGLLPEEHSMGTHLLECAGNTPL